MATVQNTGQWNGAPEKQREALALLPSAGRGTDRSTARLMPLQAVSRHASQSAMSQEGSEQGEGGHLVRSRTCRSFNLRVPSSPPNTLQMYRGPSTRTDPFSFRWRFCLSSRPAAAFWEDVHGL